MTAEAFFEELKRLIKNEVKPPVHTVSCEGCEYADHCYHSKHLYNSFDCLKCVECISTTDSIACTTCIDCSYSGDSELCYESVDAYKCFNSNYLENCRATNDSWYSSRCQNSKNLFGCVNLRNKSYCVFNRQLTPEEYEQVIANYKTWPPEKILAIVEELKKRYPLTQTNEHHNDNTNYGNYMAYNKNCYLLFDSIHNTDSAYIYDSLNQQNCYDITYSDESQLSYQVTDSVKCFNCNYIVYSNNCQDSSYIFNCLDIKNSLGVVGMDHKQYVLLNRQLTKEEYERESKIILADIKEKNLQWHNIIYY